MIIWLLKSASIQPRTNPLKLIVGKIGICFDRRKKGDRLDAKENLRGAMEAATRAILDVREIGGACAKKAEHRHDRKTLSEGRSRLYQHRFLRTNSHFAAFFKIYKILTLFAPLGSQFLEKIIHISQEVIFFSNFLKF